MSDFWEMYKKRVEDGATKLPAPPKEIGQNLIWLKAYVVDRMKAEGVTTFVGDSSKPDTFGFTEKFANYLMHYAYEAGRNERVDDYNRSTKELRASLDKIKDVLEDIGWIEYGDNW